MQQAPRLKGFVRAFKGTFGFIDAKMGTDVFCHFSEIKSDDDFRTLIVGTEVEFTLADHAGRPCAKDVVVLAPAR